MVLEGPRRSKRSFHSRFGHQAHVQSRAGNLHLRDSALGVDIRQLDIAATRDPIDPRQR